MEPRATALFRRRGSPQEEGGKAFQDARRRILQPLGQARRDGDHHQDDGDQEDLFVSEDRQADGAQDAGDTVEDDADLPLRQPEVEDQAMMHVPGVGVGRRDTAALTPVGRPGDVRDRYREREQRHREGEDDSDLGHPHDREQADRHPQEVRTGVAHEDLGGVEVEDEEAAAGPGQRRAQHHHLCLVVAGGGGRDHQHQRDDRHHARRQAVQPVQEVGGVLHPEQPEEAEWNGQHADVDRVHQRQREVVDLELSAQEQDRGQSGAGLEQQLHPVRQLEAVVEQEQDGGDAADTEDQPARLGVGGEEQGRRAEGDVEDDAAQLGDRLPMHVPALASRLLHHAGEAGDRDRDHRQHHPQRGRKQKREQRRPQVPQHHDHGRVEGAEDREGQPHRCQVTPRG